MGSPAGCIIDSEGSPGYDKRAVYTIEFVTL